MFRMRRYRVFLIIAILTTFTVYHLTISRHWDVSDLERLKQFGFNHDQSAPKPISLPTIPPPPPPPVSTGPILPEVHPGAPSTSSVGLPASTTSSPPESQATITGEELLAQQPTFEDEFGQYGLGRFDVTPRPPDQPRAYWQPQKEHFPVSPEKLIPLPSGPSKKLPKIQYSFGHESATKKADRLKRQNTVRTAFQHAWEGYRKHAFGRDELKPISNGTASPFNGWGATLVDSLDTLWIMDLKDEFEEALEMVKKIDFKTSTRKDIPLFETTIRYLGGLISAYDISTSPNRTVLVDKAVELADVLIGAFDTPNRLPIPYYRWAPSYASQPHRSSPHIVMAELGTLSMEFTRLAQITKEDKYYDAIARITDALQEWQMKTSLPGVWPVRLDASGCKKPEHLSLEDAVVGLSLESTKNAESNIDEKPEVEQSKPESDRSSLVKRQADDASPAKKADAKSQAQNSAGQSSKMGTSKDSQFELEDVDCEAQGLNSEPHAKIHTYSIGAMADSTYEYFPKEYALLGGLNEQYKNMYENAMAVIRKDFLYRPMIKDKRNILFPAKHEISPKATNPSKQKHTIYEGTHLGCFIGGMFALGAKMFDIPGDMALAERLTDGCVWAYGSTPLSIMPEEFTMVPCEDMELCSWNETRWHEWLDPQLKERTEAVEIYNKNQQTLQDQKYPDDLHANPAADESGPEKTNAPSMSDPSAKHKRAAEPEEPSKTSSGAVLDEGAEEEEEDEVSTEATPAFKPKVALSHEKYVAARIQEERLPPGYASIVSPAYKLRPEAIESVFIMYRLTGEESWREKGWNMFTAIELATRTKSGHATIKDVTSQLMELTDTMESFWLAETLKYFYLLFSEPTLISLDDYVLNTEAHPFKIPK